MGNFDHLPHSDEVLGISKEERAVIEDARAAKDEIVDCIRTTAGGRAPLLQAVVDAVEALELVEEEPYSIEQYIEDEIPRRE